MVKLVDSICDFFDNLEYKVKIAYYKHMLEIAYRTGDKYKIKYYRNKIQHIYDFYDMLKRVTSWEGCKRWRDK